MVDRADLRTGRLGWFLRLGSAAGLTLSLACLIALQALGADLTAFDLSLRGWWHGDHAWLRLIAGAGVVLLALLPVVTLGALWVQALRGRRWTLALTICGIFLVLATGLWLGLSRQAS